MNKMLVSTSSLYRNLEEGCALVLMGLWVYTAVSKIIDAQGSYGALHNQVFPTWMADVLWVGLPFIEIIAAIMVLIPYWRRYGFKLSAVLMAIFSGYILLVLTNVFGRVPCSCGGILNQLGWWEHLWFNLFFLGIAVGGIYLGRKSRDLPAASRMRET